MRCGIKPAHLLGLVFGALVLRLGGERLRTRRRKDGFALNSPVADAMRIWREVHRGGTLEDVICRGTGLRRYAHQASSDTEMHFVHEHDPKERWSFELVPVDNHSVCIVVQAIDYDRGPRALTTTVMLDPSRSVISHLENGLLAALGKLMRERIEREL